MVVPRYHGETDPNEETIEFYLDRYLDRDCSNKKS